MRNNKREIMVIKNELTIYENGNNFNVLWTYSFNVLS